MSDATTEDQYLLLFHIHSNGQVGIYVNGNKVREEHATGDETIALLVDCSEPQSWEFVYLMCTQRTAFKGVDCYIL